MMSAMETMEPAEYADVTDVPVAGLWELPVDSPILRRSLERATRGAGVPADRRISAFNSAI